MHKLRTFLITGCTQGIGRATSVHLKQLGHEVVGIARKEDATFPGQLFCADLSNTKETESVLEAIRAQYELDGIINNVGSVEPELIEDTNLDSFFNVIDLNLRPALQAMQVFLPQMKAKRYGRIVNIASRAMLGKVGRSSYSAAKSGLIGLTRTWALELAPYQITVNAVAPGPVQTESFSKNYPKGSVEEEGLIGALPLKRAGRPEEIAFSIGFFLDERAGFITGQTLFVDGGGSVGVNCL